MIRTLTENEAAIMRAYCPEHYEPHRNALVGSVFRDAILLGGYPYQSPPMKIGKHEWRAVVYLHASYGWCTSYQWRLTGAEHWADMKL